MIRGLFLTVALMTMGGEATALSCLRVDPPDAFTTAAEADEPYIVVHGTFAFDPAALPESHGEGAKDTTIAARFAGMGLTRDGFTTPLTIPVTLDATCAGPWCGSLPADTPMLAFLERRDDGYHLEVSPCPGRSFAAPDTATLDRMVACLTGDC